jgi:predicted negative regulator of RcsB-dependent stress response
MATPHEYQPNLINDEPPFFVKYWVPLAGGLLALLVGLLYYTVQQTNQTSQREAAVLELQSAPDNTAKFKVLQAHSSLPAFSTEMLRIAAAQFTAKDAKGAAATYQLFLQNHPTSEFANGARLGLAQALEADGQKDAALDLFQQAARSPGNDLYAPLATLSAARLLIAKNDYKDAKALLEPLANGATWAAGDARELLKKIPAA